MTERPSGPGAGDTEAAVAASGLALRDVTLDMARTLSGVSVEAVGEATELRRGSRAFAALSGDAIELALVPDIADAVLGTPETAPSPRGGNWIRFAPRALDQYSQDRLRAWLTTAWRLAERRS